MAITISGLEMPTTCCECFAREYDADRKWLEENGWQIGAYICGFTGNLIKNTEREEACPLMEAEPKRGRWVDVEPAPWGQVYETCSECGIRQAPDKGKDKFCGVCGARMDKEEDND